MNVLVGEAVHGVPLEFHSVSLALAYRTSFDCSVAHNWRRLFLGLIAACALCCSADRKCALVPAKILSVYFVRYSPLSHSALALETAVGPAAVAAAGAGDDADGGALLSSADCLKCESAHLCWCRASRSHQPIAADWCVAKHSIEPHPLCSANTNSNQFRWLPTASFGALTTKCYEPLREPRFCGIAWEPQWLDRRRRSWDKNPPPSVRLVSSDVAFFRWLSSDRLTCHDATEWCIAAAADEAAVGAPVAAAAGVSSSWTAIRINYRQQNSIGWGHDDSPLPIAFCPVADGTIAHAILSAPTPAFHFHRIRVRPRAIERPPLERRDFYVQQHCYWTELAAADFPWPLHLAAFDRNCSIENSANRRSAVIEKVVSFDRESEMVFEMCYFWCILKIVVSGACVTVPIVCIWICSHWFGVFCVRHFIHHLRRPSHWVVMIRGHNVLLLQEARVWFPWWSARAAN